MPIDASRCDARPNERFRRRRRGCAPPRRRARASRRPPRARDVRSAARARDRARPSTARGRCDCDARTATPSSRRARSTTAPTRRRCASAAPRDAFDGARAGRGDERVLAARARARRRGAPAAGAGVRRAEEDDVAHGGERDAGARGDARVLDETGEGAADERGGASGREREGLRWFLDVGAGCGEVTETLAKTF